MVNVPIKKAFVLLCIPDVILVSLLVFGIFSKSPVIGALPPEESIYNTNPEATPGIPICPVLPKLPVGPVKPVFPVFPVSP